MKSRSFLPLVLALIALTGCGGGGGSSDSNNSVSEGNNTDTNTDADVNENVDVDEDTDVSEMVSPVDENPSTAPTDSAENSELVASAQAPVIDANNQVSWPFGPVDSGLRLVVELSLIHI